MALPDAELMRRVQERDTEAFGVLARRHERTLRLHLSRYVGPDDAEDLRQEVLIRLWDRARQWQGRGSPLAWLLRIGTNLALNHLRARRGTVSLDCPPEEGGEEMGDPSEELTRFSREESEFRDQAARLLELMEQMPEEKRTVLRLARLQDTKLADIADQLGVPLGTVKSRLHDATRWLEARWEEEE